MAGAIGAPTYIHAGGRPDFGVPVFSSNFSCHILSQGIQKNPKWRVGGRHFAAISAYIRIPANHKFISTSTYVLSRPETRNRPGVRLRCSCLAQPQGQHQQQENAAIMATAVHARVTGTGGLFERVMSGADCTDLFHPDAERQLCESPASPPSLSSNAGCLAVRPGSA